MYLTIPEKNIILLQLLIALLLSSCFSREIYIIRGEYSDESLKKAKPEIEGEKSDVADDSSFEPVPVYLGPEYTVGIVSFRDKTKSGEVGLGEELAKVFSESIASTGLDPVFISRGDDGGEGVEFRVFGEILEFEESFSDKGILHTKVGVNIVIEEVLTGNLLVKDEIYGEFRDRKRGKITEKARALSLKNARKMAFSSLVQKAASPFIRKLNKLPFKSKIIAISDGKIYFKAGKKSRLKIGERLKVFKNQKARLLLGEILVESHQGEKISVASVALGGGLKEGDLIEKEQEMVSPL